MDRGSRTGNDSGGAASPGYQVLMIDVESTSDADQLSHYGSPCTDMCDDNQEGVVGFVAYRTQMPSWAPPATLRSGRRYNNSGPYSYLTVHIIDYPSLRPIATHSLVHRGFGSLQDECDLRAVARSATLPEHLWSLSMARKWSATLGHVDRENKLYSLICTDETRASLVHLRSFAQVDDASGKLVAGCTKASIYVASDHVDMKIVLVPSQPNLIRIVYIHRNSGMLQILNVDRTTLAFISETSINRATIHAFHYSPVHEPGLIVLLPMSSCVFICNIHTGDMVTTLYLPREARKSGQKAHGALYRPLLSQSRTSTAPAQWLVDFVQDVYFAGHENHLWKTNKCTVQIQSDLPSALWPHVLNTFVAPPVQCRAVLGAHVYLVLSPNGELSAMDMRCQGEDARRIWHVGAKFTRKKLKDVEVTSRIAASEDDPFEVVVKKVTPADVARVMAEDLGCQNQVQAKAGPQCGVASALVWTNESNHVQGNLDSDDGEYQASGAESEQGSDEDGMSEDGESEDAEEDDYANNYLLKSAFGVVALGSRGDAVLVQRGPVIAVLRRL